MVRTGRAARPLLVVLLAGLGVVLAAPSAGAHAVLVSSDPADGAALEASPEAIVLSFTEPPELELSEVVLRDDAGAAVEIPPARVVPDDPRSLQVELASPLERGAYAVSWRVTSKADGHTTAGILAFGVGVDPSAIDEIPTDVEDEPETSPVEVASRLVLIGGLVVALGGAVVALWVAPGAPPAVRRYLLAGAGLSVIGLAGLAFAQSSAARVGLGQLLGTSVGRSLLLRAAGVAVLVAGAAIAARATGPARPGLIAAAIGAAGAMLAEVQGGHAAGESAPLLNIVSQWVHFLAASAWVGGLAALLLAVRGAPDEEKAASVRRFSLMAGVALFIVAGTGTVRALNALPSWGSLIDSAYGRLVSLKILLLLGLAGLGALNRYRNVPAARRSLHGLRRIGRLEIALAVAVIGATAFLTSISPPQEDAGGPPSGPSLIVEGSDFGTTLRVRLEVRPGRPGPNEFTVVITDFDDGAPVDAERVSLRFSIGGGDESVLDLERTGPGVYAGRGPNLTAPGRYRVSVLIQQGADSVAVELQLATPCGARVLSSGDPTIYVVDLAGDASVQVYVDPGRPGTNEVHFTYFDAEGNELEVDAVPEIRAVSPEGAVRELEVRRFSQGHFIATAQLDAGRWRFEASGGAGEGSTLASCFEEEVT